MQLAWEQVAAEREQRRRRCNVHGDVRPNMGRAVCTCDASKPLPPPARPKLRIRYRNDIDLPRVGFGGTRR